MVLRRTNLLYKRCLKMQVNIAKRLFTVTGKQGILFDEQRHVLPSVTPIYSPTEESKTTTGNPSGVLCLQFCNNGVSLDLHIQATSSPRVL